LTWLNSSYENMKYYKISLQAYDEVWIFKASHKFFIYNLKYNVYNWMVALGHG